jgi:hypothetical protein
MKMHIFLLWIIFALLVGAYANTRGRSFAGFFLVSMVLSPLIGLLALLIVGTNMEKIEHEQIHRGELRRCPHCAELIQPVAVVCRYCGRDLPASSSNEFNPTPEQWDRFANALKARAKPPTS